MRNAVRQSFGKTPSGEAVELLKLDNGILTCGILTFGATLQSLQVPDRSGHPVDVVLGCDTVDAYLAHGDYLGAVVGRYANRIAKGRFVLNGQEYNLAVNNGPNHLHGGIVGFSYRVWQVEELTDTKAVLTLFSPDGEECYPGNLKVTVTYALEGKTLSIRYRAVCDQDTPCNLTNHAYFNLAGHDSGAVLDQEICLHAARYTPTDADSIPLGMEEPVAGTPMDLCRPTAIGAQIGESFVQLIQGNGYDHNYVVDGQPGVLRPAAWARSGATGITMRVETTMPGVQFYTANFIDQGREGKRGAVYGPRYGFCLETQYFPDAPNQPEFPSSILKAGETYDQTTCFRFEAE